MDNLKKKRPQDASKINIHEEWELKYWCEKFGVTKTKLVQAVNTVGVSAEKVKAYLSK